MSEKCQEETHAPQQNQHFYSITSSARSSSDAECLGDLEVHHQFELGRLLDRQVGRPGRSPPSTSAGPSERNVLLTTGLQTIGTCRPVPGSYFTATAAT